jgi:site-specific DNA recombinase
VLAAFDHMRIADDEIREWFRAVLVSQTKDAQQESLAQRAELQRQVSLTIGQQDRLLEMRLADEVDAHLFVKKQAELRDRLANLKLQLDALDRSHDETVDLAAKVFELSQTLRHQWLTADYAAKRRILEIVFLNCRLDDATLVPAIRKPFDVLANGRCVSESWGTRI